MSVIFVKQLPETFEGEYMYFKSELGFEYALVCTDSTNTDYNFITEDFVLNCENDYIQRRFKKTIYTQWHGRWASEAPLFKEFLLLLKKKHDVFLNWAIKETKNFYMTSAAGRRLKEDRDLFIESSGSIENVLNPETMEETFDGMQLALPEGYEEEEEAYNQLSIYLENQVVEQAGGLDIKSFNELQEAAAKFYKLPRIGEIVMVRSLGAYIVNDLTWNADKELAVVCTHITSGETILIPLSDLTLTPAGTWKRESLGFVENAQDAVGMMKGIARFGINSLAVFKYKDFFRIARIVAPEWLHHGEWNRYFNSFLYAMVGIIPLGGFDTAWDYLVGGWQNNFDIMTVRDPSLPLGQREYYNAITGQSSTVSKQKGMLSTAWENTKDFLTGAVEITSSVVDKTTETVTSLFYGAAILGSMAIVYKFVS
jgi:hypothetical protein